MYPAVKSRSAWDHNLRFSPARLEELRFWYSNIDSFNAYSLRPPPDSSTVIFSDASDVAFGGFLASLDGLTASGLFTSEDLGQSSTYRELKAIYYVLLSYEEQLRQTRVLVFTDNQGAAGIVSVDSSKVLLQSVAMSVFGSCLLHEITLEAQWIPRSQNARADLLSRFVDKDDWCVNSSVFRLLDTRWGPHTFHRFATYYNAQLPWFNSKFSSLGCSGVEALWQEWRGENNWICPEVSLIVDPVRHLMSYSGRETLIIPECPYAHFWPFLHKGLLGLARLSRRCLFCLHLMICCRRILVTEAHL